MLPLKLFHCLLGKLISDVFPDAWSNTAESLPGIVGIDSVYFVALLTHGAKSPKQKVLAISRADFKDKSSESLEVPHTPPDEVTDEGKRLPRLPSRHPRGGSPGGWMNKLPDLESPF